MSRKGAEQEEKRSVNVSRKSENNIKRCFNTHLWEMWERAASHHVTTSLRLTNREIRPKCCCRIKLFSVETWYELGKSRFRSCGSVARVKFIVTKVLPFTSVIAFTSMLFSQRLSCWCLSQFINAEELMTVFRTLFHPFRAIFLLPAEPVVACRNLISTIKKFLHRSFSRSVEEFQWYETSHHALQHPSPEDEVEHVRFSSIFEEQIEFDP